LHGLLEFHHLHPALNQVLRTFQLESSYARSTNDFLPFAALSSLAKLGMKSEMDNIHEKKVNTMSKEKRKTDIST
jgi:hypothetical protein